MVGSVWRRSLKCGGAAGGRDGLVLYLDGDGGSLDCIYTLVKACVTKEELHGVAIIS